MKLNSPYRSTFSSIIHELIKDDLRSFHSAAQTRTNALFSSYISLFLTQVINSAAMTDTKKLTEIIKREEFTYSLEVTPDVNSDDITNIDMEPAFFSVTWHAKAHQCKDLNIPPLETASFLRSKNKQVLMHLSCDMMRKHYLEKVLAFLQEKGICNLFIVLGESFDASLSDFSNTSELIKYIREISGRYFCMGVAGYCESTEEKLLELKEKIDQGADFIVTQALFEAHIYKTFVQKCAARGITVPVIPGLFPFENFNQLTNFMNLCKVKVSSDLLEYVKNNETREMAGVEVMKTLIQTIRSDFPATHFHFFTLNKIQSVCNVIKQI